MATGGVKKTRTAGNRAHKNTDKIGFTVLTFSEGLHVRTDLVYVCKACEFVYVCLYVSIVGCVPVRLY